MCLCLHMRLHASQGTVRIWSMTDKMLCFWAIFALLPPLATWKIKILKKWKKCLEILFYTSIKTKNYDPMLYCSWDMTCDRCNFYFSYWDIFCTVTPLAGWKRKKEKKHLHMIRWCVVPEIWCAVDEQRDRQTDWQADRKINI